MGVNVISHERLLAEFDRLRAQVFVLSTRELCEVLASEHHLCPDEVERVVQQRDQVAA